MSWFPDIPDGYAVEGDAGDGQVRAAADRRSVGHQRSLQDQQSGSLVADRASEER